MNVLNCWKRSLCLCLALTVAPLTAADAKPGAKGKAGKDKVKHNWTVLFDGKSLDGWEQKNGTATYEIKDGAVLGSTVEGSPNSFLCTTKDYGDFVLQYETKLLRDDLNSGVQIRSHSREDFKNGRVNGPQVETESSPGQAGYIYGEASTGQWISPGADEKPHEHFKKGEWNKYRVRAEGDHVQVWLNGEKITDVKSSDLNADDPGFIGLQVHSYKGEHPAQVMWRNIRVRELKPKASGEAAANN